jgi:hypothetical protein
VREGPEPDYLTTPEILRALQIVPDLDQASFVFEDSDGSRFTLVLAAPPRGGTVTWLAVPHNAQPAPPFYRRNRSLWYWFDYLPDRKLLYLKYDVCASTPTLPFLDFVSQVGDFANSHELRYFVLDLRNNEGGNDAVIQPLFQGLQQAIAQGAIDPSLQVFGITGRETFSSGMNNAIQFKSLGVTLVGEPTGGKPNHFGSPTTIALPNSGLSVNCSTRVIQFPGFDGVSLVPDIPVSFTVSDYLAERDPAVAAILSRTR